MVRIVGTLFAMTLLFAFLAPVAASQTPAMQLLYLHGGCATLETAAANVCVRNGYKNSTRVECDASNNQLFTNI